MKTWPSELGMKVTAIVLNKESGWSRKLEEVLSQSIQSAKEEELKRKVLEILEDEIATAHTTKAGKTSRLTSAYNRISELFAKP